MTVENLRRIMKEKKVTNQQLSDMTGISVGTINKITCGQTKNPRLDNMRTIAKALGVTLDDFTDPDPYDEDLLQILDKLRYRPEMRMLFSISKNATKEDIENTVKIIEMLKGKE